MADIAAIREGLKARLETITGLRAFAYIPDSVPIPAAVVGPPETDFDLTMRRGADTLRFPIRVYACRTNERAAQAKLDSFFETNNGEQRLVDEDGVYLTDESGAYLVLDAAAQSVKAAIEGDTTLGGAAQTLRVVRASGYGVYDIAGVPVLGAEWLVEVIASGEV